MEMMNQLRRVFHQFHRLPGQFVITNPVNKIFQGCANKLGVQDFSNLEFNIVINKIGGGAACFCPARGLEVAGSRSETWNIGSTSWNLGGPAYEHDWRFSG